MVCLFCSSCVGPKVKKNWLPLSSLPELAMATKPRRQNLSLIKIMHISLKLNSEQNKINEYRDNTLNGTHLWMGFRKCFHRRDPFRSGHRLEQWTLRKKKKRLESQNLGLVRAFWYENYVSKYSTFNESVKFRLGIIVFHAELDKVPASFGGFARPELNLDVANRRL